MNFRDNLLYVQNRIQKACARSGRDPSEVRLVAVTKYLDVEGTSQLLDAGVEDVGESRVQQAVPKWEQLGDRGTWHFIGHLQTNKVKAVLDKFHYIHSLDRISLLEKIEKEAARMNRIIPCFLQVNVAREPSKSGLFPHEVEAFVEKIGNMDYIRVVGLMTMAPKVQNPEEVRWVFRTLREIRQKVQEMGVPQVPAQHLSMGMSNDFEVAIEEGATYIRLGSVLVHGSGKDK